MREERVRGASRGHDTPHAAPHVLHGDGEGGDEPEGAAIHHGPQGHQDDARVLRPYGRLHGCGGDATRRGVVKTRFTTRFTTHGHQDAPGFIKIRELPQKAKKPGTPLESGITGFREVMGTCWKMSR